MTAVRSGSTITKSAFEPLLITPLSGYRLNRLALLVAQTPRRRSIPIRLRLYPSVSSIGSINSMPGWRSGGAFPIRSLCLHSQSSRPSLLVVMWSVPTCCIVRCEAPSRAASGCARFEVAVISSPRTPRSSFFNEMCHQRLARNLDPPRLMTRQRLDIFGATNVDGVRVCVRVAGERCLLLYLHRLRDVRRRVDPRL